MLLQPRSECCQLTGATGGPAKLDISYPATEFTKIVKSWEPFNPATMGISIRNVKRCVMSPCVCVRAFLSHALTPSTPVTAHLFLNSFSLTELVQRLNPRASSVPNLERYGAHHEDICAADGFFGCSPPLLLRCRRQGMARMSTLPRKSQGWTRLILYPKIHLLSTLCQGPHP